MLTRGGYAATGLIDVTAGSPGVAGEAGAGSRGAVAVTRGTALSVVGCAALCAFVDYTTQQLSHDCFANNHHDVMCSAVIYFYNKLMTGNK